MINGKKLIALCTSRVYEPQIHGYIVELNEKLRAEGYSLLIFAINSDIYWEDKRPAAEKYVFDIIPYKYIDAIVIMDEKIKSHNVAKKIIVRAQDFDVPVIIADGHYDNTSCINFDYDKGFELVCRHMIEDHKVTRPHMMAGQPDNEFSNRRIEVFKKVLADNNIPFDKSMISYGYFWADPCRIATQRLIDKYNETKELPEAIICANDIMAITVSEMFSEIGVRIPEDMLISGFDGYYEIFFSSPKVTTASCDIILLADATAEVVFETLADKKPHKHFIAPVLLPNESCGCPECTQHPHIIRDLFKESFARHNDDNRVLKRLTASMQISKDTAEMVSFLDCYKTDDILAVVDRKIFEESEDNYFTDSSHSAAKDLVLIYDSDHKDKYKSDSFVLPDSINEPSEDVLSPAFRDRILELTESGYPLIFNALDYMSKAFGFICYFIRNYYISNYTNTINATNSISTGIGGHINIQYQRMLLEKMDEMYRHDPLTGLYNRIGFHNDFKKLCKSQKYKNQKVTVIMSDLDGLKYINDHFGHADGDKAIAMTAEALLDSVPENSLSARFGGDEIFAVILGSCDPEKIIRHIDQYLEKYNENSGKPYDVSTSCGYIVSTLDEVFDITQAVKDADTKMYEVKSEKYSKNPPLS